VSKRIVDDPSQHGWVEVDGKWVWGASGGSGGSIQDGDTEGQITTWDGVEWTPEGAVVVNSSGKVGIGNDSPKTRLDVSDGSNTVARFTGTSAHANIQIVSAGTTNRSRVQFGDEDNEFIGSIQYFHTDDSMMFHTNTSERMRIDADGKVLVGTDNGSGTTAKLQVAGDVHATGNARFVGNLNVASYMNYNTPSQLNDTIRFGASNENSVGNGRAYGFEVFTNGETQYTDLRWCIGSKIKSTHDANTNGDVDEVFTVTGSGNVTATGNITAYSDERLKSDVETLDGSKVFDMRGVSFTKDGKAGSGVIAQELQKIAPELVNDSGEYLSVAYGNLVGYLIEAVKELKAEIEDLKRG